MCCKMYKVQKFVTPFSSDTLQTHIQFGISLELNKNIQTFLWPISYTNFFLIRKFLCIKRDCTITITFSRIFPKYVGKITFTTLPKAFLTACSSSSNRKSKTTLTQTRYKLGTAPPKLILSHWDHLIEAASLPLCH